MSKDKKHADFQNEYKKSSNFGKSTKDENLKIDGDGDLKKDKNLNNLSVKDKDKIAKSMDNMQHNIDMIPGEDRSN